LQHVLALMRGGVSIAALTHALNIRVVGFPCARSNETYVDADARFLAHPHCESVCICFAGAETCCAASAIFAARSTLLSNENRRKISSSNAVGALRYIGRFKSMNTKALAIILAVGTAITLSAGAQANDRGDSGIFCAAIGLSKANQMTCTKQLVVATSEYNRASIQTKWVARSGLVAGPDYYVSKVGFVPNRVTAEINRALKAALTTPEWKTQVAETEKVHLSYASIEYTN